MLHSGISKSEVPEISTQATKDPLWFWSHWADATGSPNEKWCHDYTDFGKKIKI